MDLWKRARLCPRCASATKPGRKFCSLACAHRAQMGALRRDSVLPTERLTMANIYWAAGFIEGEGNFGRTGGRTNHTTERVQAAQLERECLDKLSAWFGGRIRQRNEKANRLSSNRVWNWELTGAQARGLMYTLYSLLSEKRKQQVRRALSRQSAA